jgi:hypothetical protein
MLTNEIIINVEFKNEFLAAAKKHSVNVRKTDQYTQDEHERTGERITVAQYELPEGERAEALIDELERMFEQRDGGNYDRYYFHSFWFNSPFQIERDNAYMALEAAQANFKQFRANVEATALAKAQQAAWAA